MQLPPGAGVRVLDERAFLAQGPGVMAEGAVLELFAPAEPREAMQQLRALGLVVTSEVQEGGWRVRAGKGSLASLVDLTGLEAPEPMHRVLHALSKLAPGEVFLALLPHRPAPLLPLLDARGASYDVALRPDGTALLWLSR